MPKFYFDPDTMMHTMDGPNQQYVRDAIIKAFASDVDGKIHQALIELGWTPPHTSHYQRALARLRRSGATIETSDIPGLVSVNGVEMTIAQVVDAASKLDA